MAKNEAPAKDEAADEAAPKGKVKVKLLRHVGEWAPGDVAEVSEALAKELCAVRTINDGPVPTKYSKAVRLDEVEKGEKLVLTKAQIAKMTQHELTQLGKKNIVATPVDGAFEAQLAKMKKVAEKAMSEGKPSRILPQGMKAEAKED
jgi:hypothetical protein